MKWNPNAKLTDRELEYAELLAWGGARKEVAERLGVADSTVINTAKVIFRKLGIQKVTELSVWWFVMKANVPISMDPWKRTLPSLLLLLIILPRELSFSGDVFRRSERTRIVRTAARTRRSREDTITL